MSAPAGIADFGGEDEPSADYRANWRSRVLVRRGLVVLMTTAMLVTPAIARSEPAPPPPMTVLEQGKLYGHLFPVDPPPAGQTPQSRADWLIDERETLGRTPNAWVDWAKASFVPGAASAPASATARAEIATSVLKLYRLAGITPSLADVRAVTASAARLSPSVQGAFGELVSTVTTAYAAQAPIAKAVEARIAKGFDPVNPYLTIAERDAMHARQAAIAKAVERFRVATAGLVPVTTAASTPLFRDPMGLVILGGPGDDTYTRDTDGTPDPVLLVDLGGNDDYFNSAGGACPVKIGGWMACNMLAVSVAADLGSGETPRDVVVPRQDGTTRVAQVNDYYSYSGGPAAVQGAGGPGGLGVLVDVAGNDWYLSKMVRTEFEPIQYFDGGAQGFGYAGVGVIADGAGNDWYWADVDSPDGKSVSNFSQGFGGAGGSGISIDADGSDWWIGRAYGGIGSGFSGVYGQGTGFYGGVGVMADLGADRDWYVGLAKAGTVDYYAQGFGAFGGLGILYEDGGDDKYSAIEEATSPNPLISQLLNCAYGTASYGGVGVMIDVAGNDYGYGMTKSAKGAFVMDWGWGGPGPAYSAFVDGAGDDIYKLEAFAGTGARIAGWGYFEADNPFDGNTFSTFVDYGGNDTYIGADTNVIKNNAVWAFGVDQSA